MFGVASRRHRLFEVMTQQFDVESAGERTEQSTEGNRGTGSVSKLS